MITGQTLIVGDYDIFKKLANEEYASLKIEGFLNRFDNVLIGTNEVANMHSVNPRTVLNYIADGLITPEPKLGENDHHQFRLSYALTLDFKKLQKELRAQKKLLMYRILLKNEKGKQYFYSEIYRTRAEADSIFEIMQEEGERVVAVVEANEIY